MRYFHQGWFRQQFQQQFQFLRRQFLQDDALSFGDVLSEVIVAMALTENAVDWVDPCSTSGLRVKFKVRGQFGTGKDNAGDQRAEVCHGQRTFMPHNDVLMVTEGRELVLVRRELHAKNERLARMSHCAHL